jgi:ABC-2 type transport system permease protein/Cu-processing system permease protein
MANPLDAFRVTILFSVERAAFSGLNAGRLAGWWVGHAPLWLAIVFTLWAGGSSVAAWLGARRRLDA